tara:strand:+ start:38 stop:361 length:324 start_codon:yes stop_codon:yes gene_type:complete
MQNNAWGKNMNTDSKKEEKKDEYKPDIRVQRLWKSLEENKRKQRHEAFHKWLKNEYKYGENFIEVEEILEHLCKDVFKMLNEHGLTITNEKQLRNEIATFVYKESYA